LSSGAPLLASRLRLQYRHTTLTTSFLLASLIPPPPWPEARDEDDEGDAERYATMRSASLCGTTGGAREKVGWYARADLVPPATAAAGGAAAAVVLELAAAGSAGSLNVSLRSDGSGAAAAAVGAGAGAGAVEVEAEADADEAARTSWFWLSDVAEPGGTRLDADDGPALRGAAARGWVVCETLLSLNQRSRSASERERPSRKGGGARTHLAMPVAVRPELARRGRALAHLERQAVLARARDVERRVARAVGAPVAERG